MALETGDNTDARLEEAAAAIEREEFEQAILSLKHLLDKDPNDATPEEIRDAYYTAERRNIGIFQATRKILALNK